MLHSETCLKNKIEQNKIKKGLIRHTASVEPDSLNLIPETHMVEDGNQLWKVVPALGRGGRRMRDSKSSLVTYGCEAGLGYRILCLRK